MQGPKGNSAGVVQWFVPPSKQLKQPYSKTNPRKQKEEPRRSQPSSAATGDQAHSSTNTNNSNSNNQRAQQKPSLDSIDSDQLSDIIVCRTICTFVDQHLKDLTGHQKLIDEVRCNCGTICEDQELVKSGLISQLELSKLRIRDEQTKAIVTIKQLTSYLREMTKIKFHCESVNENFQEDQDNEEILILISEKRTDIIQALNDFVLSNSDIDVPIITNNDISYHEYDLCADAREVSSPTWAATRLTSSQSTSSSNLSESGRFSMSGTRDSSVKRCSSRDNLRPLVEIDDELDDISERQLTLQESKPDEHALSLEKRRREMEKLSRDTLELRRLFSDFYNLVKTQGEQLDTIEDNIVIARHSVCEGQRNLSKARKSLTIIMPMTGCITGALVGGPIGLAIGSKVGGISMVCAASLVGFLSSYGVLRCIAPDKLKGQ